MRANGVFNGEWGLVPQAGQVVTAADYAGTVALSPPKVMEV